MKELSIEEKAKRYDEAIKVARSKIKNDKDHVLYEEDITDIFPVFKESEDEKIRQFLIHEVAETSDKIMSYRNMNKKDVLAWLERQGEQKLPIEKLPSEMKSIGESLGFTTQKECDKYNQMVTDLIMSDDDNGEQKPTEWSEEDSRILYNVKAYIGYAAGQSGVKDELFKEANEWLNSLPIGFIYSKNYNEDMVTLLVSELKQIANDNNVPEQYQMEINWLKSLRPQKQWKPSEEQMKALDDVISSRDIKYDVLSELYKDLKKLREE